jgi:flagellar motor switch protein FliG
MGVYSRFKKSPDGLRQLVELLESTPSARRQKMIDVGMEEDAEYTQKALQYVFTFEDILRLPELELAEVLNIALPRMIGLAIHAASAEIKNKFLTKVNPRAVAEVKEVLETSNVTLTQVAAGQFKLIEAARKMEKRGLVKTKKIPT